MAATSTVRACNERVTCLRIFADANGETHMEDIDIDLSKAKWINEERFHVLDGWLKENLAELFANVLRAKTEEDRMEARAILLEKMNSLYERDLRDHMYAVARSTKIL